MDESCITEVSPGTVVDVDSGIGDAKCAFPLIKPNISAPLIQIYASDVHMQTPDGVAGFTSFTADFKVPPKPSKYKFQTVYFWPGFKSEKPEMGYPVIQPVLQYGEQHDGHGDSWQLQSWFVDANSMWYPVHTAPAIKVNPGDQISTHMKLDGDTWTIAAIDTTTNQNSTLQV